MSSPPSPVAPREWALMFAVSVLLLGASLTRVWSISLTESLGFVSGGVCVWLVVREHLANWPVGLANNVVFGVLFWQSRLYADMGLQVIYFGLGVWGWWRWLRGGPEQSRLTISRTTPSEWLALLILIPSVTWLLRTVLLAVNGAAPWGDAITTALSLGAQYLLCQKRLENWFFWILADLIYIPLYLSRQLPLTALLYGVFLLMCVIGYRSWRTQWNRSLNSPSAS
ncbi:MAG: nicotinamide mononucleotide transporter [Verrucomicrobia bacterium]|nr:nicotinamide mononucleotide transporter [Verrucomicrobiota bacterium]